MFDFLIFNKPVLLFMPDLHEYILGKRGIYNYFENILKSYSITSWDVLINEIKNTRENKIPLLSKIAQDTNLMTNTNPKIYEDILARLS